MVIAIIYVNSSACALRSISHRPGMLAPARAPRAATPWPYAATRLRTLLRIPPPALLLLPHASSCATRTLSTRPATGTSTPTLHGTCTRTGTRALDILEGLPEILLWRSVVRLPRCASCSNREGGGTPLSIDNVGKSACARCFSAGPPILAMMCRQRVVPIWRNSGEW